MTHEVDKFGFPVDPKLRELEDLLCDIAADFRQSSSQEEQRGHISRYHSVVAELLRLGWFAYIEWECLLPSDLMPKDYVRITHERSQD